MYTPNQIFFIHKKLIFFQTKRYQDFIISDGALYNQNEYY